MPVLAFVGFSNTGKTSLIERLTKALSTKGYKVAVIKHHGHMDELGKIHGATKGQVRQLLD